MKHHQEIAKQRYFNARAGIATSEVHIQALQDKISNLKAKDFEDNKESLVEELEEIKEFLIWVKNQ